MPEVIVTIDVSIEEQEFTSQDGRVVVMEAVRAGDFEIVAVKVVLQPM